MSNEIKELAINLRKQGNSLNDISFITKKAKSTISIWVRNVAITTDLRFKLNTKQDEARKNGSKANQEKFRLKRELVYNETKQIASDLLKDQDIRDFIVAYYCEGAKTKRNSLDFTNTEPIIVKLFMKVVKKFTEKDFYLRVICHEEENYNNILEFWAKELNIDKSNIKIQLKPGKCAKNRFKFGTFKVEISDTYAMCKIYALMDTLLEEWNLKY